MLLANLAGKQDLGKALLHVTSTVTVEGPRSTQW